MGLIDAIVVLLVLAFVVSRFFGFKLPRDPRKPKERRMDWTKLRESFRGGEMKDVTPVEEKPAARDTATRTRPAKGKRPSLVGLSGIEQIKALDEGFDEQGFKDGAAAAYKYFCECWNAQDAEGLDKLCGPELMERLETSMQDYRDRGVTPWVADVAVGNVEIVDARVVGRSAVVEVEISARQREGEMKVDKKDTGKRDPGKGVAHEVQVRWVLARPLVSDDPNWELQKVEHVGGRA